MHTFAKAVLSSIGTIFASQTATTPGTIVVEQSSNWNIRSCSEETITIDFVHNNNNALLEPGSILTYIGSSDDICSPCHTLFRKIASQKDENTYVTEYVTFAEVFPKSVYDESLADAFIEPMLQKCQPSDKEYYYDSEHRYLGADDNAPTQAPTKTPATPCNGGIFALMATSLCVMGSFCVPLFPLFCFPGWAIFAACGGAFMFPWFNVNGAPVRRKLLPLNQPVLQQQMLIRDYPPVVVPTSFEEWTKTDNDGNCLYVDNCNVGRNNNGNSSSSQSCFHYSRDDSSSICRHLESNHEGENMISLPNHPIGFKEVCYLQDICYSSNIPKDLCDQHYYATMRDSCPSSSRDTIVFPLEETSLGQNCNLLALLFYIGAKDFGHQTYQELQFKQQKHKASVCAR